MKVLVAEDNLDSRELLSEILEMLGCQVIVAVDGREALQRISSENPDLCILDVDMPYKSGFDVVEAMKATPALSNIPVIMLTAQSDVESRVKGLGLGADDYLTKPFNPRELVARVNTRMRAKAHTDDLRDQRELIQRTFSRYVAQEIIDTMLANPGGVKLGGQVRPVTVMFADLEGFTSLSENGDPSEMLELLNQYHGLLVSVVRNHGGIIDKFLGDGLMALFNVPIDQDQHVEQAVRAALAAHNALRIFHETIAPSYRMGINFGINTGTAMVGNVGAAELMDYTAVGDAVNLAARLQTMSRGSQITVSQEVYEQVKQWVQAQYIGPCYVKGREKPVIVYQITSLK